MARTSTFALTNATMSYGLKLADEGYFNAFVSDAALMKGLNVVAGKVVRGPVAEALGYEYSVPDDTLRETIGGLEA